MKTSFETWDEVVTGQMVRNSHFWYIKTSNGVTLTNSAFNPVEDGWIVLNHKPYGPFWMPRFSFCP